MLAEPSCSVNTAVNLRRCQWHMANGVRRMAPSFYNIDYSGLVSQVPLLRDELGVVGKKVLCN